MRISIYLYTFNGNSNAKMEIFQSYISRELFVIFYMKWPITDVSPRESNVYVKSRCSAVALLQLQLIYDSIRRILNKQNKKLNYYVCLEILQPILYSSSLNNVR